ncbi:transcription factor TCP19-like, partial [Cornus florida]|uniref:transcription factor TCP19-like n=1 Tax=Cornus florida TaxID=4283 RepID=UPI0028965A2F
LRVKPALLSLSLNAEPLISVSASAFPLLLPPPSTPSSTLTTTSEGDSSRKKRKRACNSDFYDVNDSVSSNFASVAPVTLQGLVPVWAVGGGARVLPPNAIPDGAFFMIPPAGAAIAGPSNQPQLWAILVTATPAFNVSAFPLLLPPPRRVNVY